MSASDGSIGVNQRLQLVREVVILPPLQQKVLNFRTTGALKGVPPSPEVEMHPREFPWKGTLPRQVSVVPSHQAGGGSAGGGKGGRRISPCILRGTPLVGALGSPGSTCSDRN